MPKPTTLASGQITAAGEIAVELHTPATEPAFILVEWPAAPSVASPDTSASWWPRCSASWPKPASL